MGKPRPGTAPRLPNGPQVLCRVCGAISNHITGLCDDHRTPDIICRRGRLSQADYAYLEWKRQKDADNG